jgi:hypothetical protein
MASEDLRMSKNVLPAGKRKYITLMVSEKLNN